MAYHFRKLRQALRLIPSTKSIGFSTRVNEGDQKNSHLDGSSASTHVDGCPGKIQRETSSETVVASLDDGLSNGSINSACTLLRSQSDTDLLSNLKPFPHVRSTALPVAYKDIAQVMLPRISDKSEDRDPIFSVMKSVGFTSDDILVHLTDSFSSNNAAVSIREHIPIDILTQNYYRRLAKDPAASSSRGLQLSGSIVYNDNGTHSSAEGCINQPHVCYSSSGGTSSGPKGNSNSKEGPSPEQMLQAREKLEQMVMNLFKGKHNYEMLHKQVVLENNLFGGNKTSVGVSGYKIELYKLRLCIHIQLFSTSMEILSVTTLEQTGVIRIHWRLKGLPQNLHFWRLFQSSETINKDDWEWLEAFSYFHIGKDGLVYKHRIDRMMPDDTQTDLTEKLRGLLHPAKPLVN